MGAREYFRHFLGLKILGLSFFWVDKKSVQMSIPIFDFIECPPGRKGSWLQVWLRFQ